MSTVKRISHINRPTVEAKVCVAELTSVEQQHSDLKAALSALIITIAAVLSIA